MDERDPFKIPDEELWRMAQRVFGSVQQEGEIRDTDFSVGSRSVTESRPAESGQTGSKPRGVIDLGRKDVRLGRPFPRSGNNPRS